MTQEVQLKDELTKLINICSANLTTSKDCTSYLFKDRRFSFDIVEKYKIGYFPQNIKKLTEYVDADTLLKSNIITTYSYSEYAHYHSLIFPLIDEWNMPVGISGRALLNAEERQYLDIPKYKNSSFDKGSYLFGLNFARNSIIKLNNVYVVEGFFDQMSLAQKNILNSVAICGTAFTKKHFLKLVKYTNQITFILDSDEAGKRSVEKIYEKFINNGIKLRFLSMPDGYKDIDEYFFKHSNNKETFEQDFVNFIPGV